MIWDVSPVAFTLALGATKPVYWYGLLFASTFIYGIVIFQYVYRLEHRPPDDVYELLLWVIGGTVAGARLGHVLAYDPAYYFSHPLEIPQVWKGGLASHGGVLGILLGVFLHALRKPDQSFLWVCDRIGMAGPLSGCLIRIGNFFNSEILGKPTDVPWGVVFARVDPLTRHPVQLYEAFAYLCIFLLQFRYYLRHKSACPPGMLSGRFFVLAFGARFLLEFFKEEQAAFASAWPLTMGQNLSIPLIALGMYLIWRAGRFSRPDPAGKV
jgi:prolipoprotein diacylglyceryl transferase